MKVMIGGAPSLRRSAPRSARTATRQTPLPPQKRRWETLPDAGGDADGTCAASNLHNGAESEETAMPSPRFPTTSLFPARFSRLPQILRFVPFFVERYNETGTIRC